MLRFGRGFSIFDKKITKGVQMKTKSLILLIGFIAPLMMLGLVSCGGGNEVASSGASAVSATASVSNPDASPIGSPSTITATKQTTEPKVNGQIDERTGVAAVAAQLSVSNNVFCLASATYGGTGPLLTDTTVPTLAQCAGVLPGIATGNPWTIFSNGGCLHSKTIYPYSGFDVKPDIDLLSDPQKAACLKEANRISDTWPNATYEDINECKALGGLTSVGCPCIWPDVKFDHCSF